ncbi:MAG: hypothetical protein LBJ38_00075 [Oscillospiraceae bacterium]|jgi:cell division septum initiation protein DivIVA|nr:hypothetical protein [Oscillospiraceae bacterium]
MAINKLDELLNVLEHLLTKGVNVPLSGGRALVCVSDAVDVLGEIRESLPSEIRIAGDIAEREENILDNAKKSAQLIVQKAEEKARELLNEEKIMQQAAAKAQDVVREAVMNSKDIKASTYKFLYEVFDLAENGLIACLNDVKNAKSAIKQDGDRDGPSKRLEKS